VSEGTIQDLINRVKREGVLLRNEGAHSIKTVEVKVDIFTDVLKSIHSELETQTKLFMIMTDQLANEANVLNEMLRDAKRTGDTAGVGGKRKEPRGDRTAPLDEVANEEAAIDLSGLLGLSAAAIGALAGAFSGWIKALKFFTPGFVVKALDFMKSQIVGSIMTIGKTIGTTLMDGMKFIRGPILAMFMNISLALQNPALVKAIDFVKTVGRYVVTPFMEAGKMLNSLLGIGKSLQSGFGMIGSLLGSFGGTIKAVSGVVGKLFYPLTIILTAFDTIKGALDGYAEGGWLGALEGGIVGFVTSLVTKPLDLIKSVGSWIVGKLGFENAAEVLDSFSFTEIFTSMVGGIFDFVRSAGAWVANQFKWEEGSVLFDLTTYISDTWDSTSEYISTKFKEFSDYVGAIPDRMWFYAQEVWIDITAKLKKGFIMLGDWIASIPAKIKYMALSTIAEYDPTGLLVSPEDVTAAKAEVDSRASGTSAKLAQVDRETATQRQTLAEQKAAALNENATANSGAKTVISAPTVVNGGSTSNMSSSSTTIINAAPHTSLNAFMPI
jgi:hypothetical protein